MNKSLHSFVRFIMPIMLIGMLSGCVRGRMEVNIHENGSADLDYRLADKGLSFLKDDPVNRIRSRAALEGFKVSDYRDGEYQGFRAVKHLPNIEQLPNFQKNVFGSGGGKACVARKGLFSSIYRFDTTVNFLHMSYLTEHGVDPVTMKRIEIAFRLTLPGKVVATNADRILPNGNAAEWMLKAGNNKIYAESEVIHWMNIAILITIIVTVLVLGYIYFTRGETFSGEHKRG